MAKKAEDVFAKLQEKLANKLRELPAIVGNEAVNFSLQSFDQEAWSGSSQEVWPKRKNPTKWGKRDDTGRNLLIKTGKLRRSIRITELHSDRVKIGAGGADIPYARVHNEGFSGAVHQNVESHFRKGKKGENIKVNAFQRTIQQNIPKRQFIGGMKDSPYLKQRIVRVCKAEINKVIKQYL